MGVLEAVVSGVVQGLTEFLPVSSSGHLVILHTLFGYKEPKVLEDVLLHVGTLAAVIIFFRRDIITLLRDRKQLFLIIIGSIPIVTAGLIFGKTIESFFANTKVVSMALLVTGVWLFAGDIISRNTQYAIRNTQLSVWHAFVIGIAQAIALIPGVSRSGATISTGLLLRRDRYEAFRFSFLLFIPAILAALVYKMGNLLDVEAEGLITMACGSITACIVGVIALWLLKRVLLKEKLYFFGIYCWVVGLVVLLA